MAARRVCVPQDTPFIISVSIIYDTTTTTSVKVMGQGQGHTTVTKYTFAGGQPLTE